MPLTLHDLHLPLAAYYDLLQQGALSQEHIPVLERALATFGADRVAVFGAAASGEVFKRLLGPRFLGFLTTEGLTAERAGSPDPGILAQAGAVLVATGPVHYPAVCRTLATALDEVLGTRDVPVILPFARERRRAGGDLGVTASASGPAAASGQVPVEAQGFYDFIKLAIHVTNRCNLRCVMCPLAQARHHADETLGRAEAEEAVRFGLAHGFRIIELIGGEPFLLDYVYDLVDMAGNVVPELVVATNATVFRDQDLMRLSRARNLRLQVSIDGVGGTHDAIRGREGAFEKAEGALRRLAALDVSVSLSTVIQRRNAGELFEVYRRFADLPYAEHCFFLYEPDSPNLDQVALRPEDAGALGVELRRVKAAAEAEGKPVRLTERLIETFARRVAEADGAHEDAGGQGQQGQHPGLPGGQGDPRHPRHPHPGLLCTVPRRGVIVTHDGNVVPCYQFPWHRTATRRNIVQRPMAEIVFSQEYMDDVRRATGPGGCAGCSAQCYMFDPDFRRKMTEPSLADRLLAEAAATWGRKRGRASDAPGGEA